MNRLRSAKKDNLEKKSFANHFVNLRPQNVGAPLFCIHPSGGDVGVYRKLIKNLPAHFSAMGIQSRLIAGEEDEFGSIEEMASVYAKLISSFQKDGPIRLLGFSFGGFVATAISNNLIEQKRDVSFLGIVDSDLRWVNDEASIRSELEVRLTQLSLQFQQLGVFQKYAIEKTEEDVRGMVDMSLGKEKVDFEDWLEFLQSRGYIDQENPQAQLLCRFAARFKTHCSLLTEFKVQEFTTPLNIWWPTEPDTDVGARRAAWQNYTPHPITERAFSGSHYSIMRMPTVASMAQDIADRLTATENNSALEF